MSRDWRLRIEDILGCIKRIESYTSSCTEESFAQNQLVIDAVVRNLEIIGEAARHIPEDLKTTHPEIPWAEMQAMRNLLAHEYFGVSIPIVWNTVKNNLPPLKPLLQDLLDCA